MTRAVSFTQASLRRAIEAARKAGPRVTDQNRCPCGTSAMIPTKITSRRSPHIPIGPSSRRSRRRPQHCAAHLTQGAVP
jgi:hypothetical protein